MGKPKLYEKHELVAMLQSAANSSSQKELAAEIGVTPQYLCDVLKNRREPAGAILKHLRLRDLGKRYGE